MTMDQLVEVQLTQVLFLHPVILSIGSDLKVLLCPFIGFYWFCFFFKILAMSNVL